MNFPLHRGLLNKKILGPFGPVRPAGLDFQARPGQARGQPGPLPSLLSIYKYILLIYEISVIVIYRVTKNSVYTIKFYRVFRKIYER